MQRAKPAKFQAVACLCPNVYSSRTTASLLEMLFTVWLTTVMYRRTILVDTYEWPTWKKLDMNSIPIIIVVLLVRLSLDTRIYTTAVETAINPTTLEICMVD